MKAGPIRHDTTGQVVTRWLGVALVLLSLVSVLGIVRFNAHRAETLACQQRVTGELVDAVRARAAIADRDRQALDELVLAVITATDRTRTEAALQAYVDTIERSARARRAVRLPDRATYRDCGAIT